jgi:hypothetical protein
MLRHPERAVPQREAPGAARRTASIGRNVRDDSGCMALWFSDEARSLSGSLPPGGSKCSRAEYLTV